MRNVFILLFLFSCSKNFIYKKNKNSSSIFLTKSIYYDINDTVVNKCFSLINLHNLEINLKNQKLTKKEKYFLRSSQYTLESNCIGLYYLTQYNLKLKYYISIPILLYNNEIYINTYMVDGRIATKDFGQIETDILNFQKNNIKYFSKNDMNKLIGLYKNGINNHVKWK